MNNAAIANWREQLSANKRSGLNILTDDIKNPMWKVNVPLKNLSTSNHELCERWMLVFKSMFSESHLSSISGTKMKKLLLAIFIILPLGGCTVHGNKS